MLLAIPGHGGVLGARLLVDVVLAEGTLGTVGDAFTLDRWNW